MKIVPVIVGGTHQSLKIELMIHDIVVDDHLRKKIPAIIMIMSVLENRCQCTLYYHVVLFFRSKAAKNLKHS